MIIFIIAFLSFLVISLLLVLSLLWLDIHHITADLLYINSHTTNAGITSNLHFGSIQRLTTAMNQTLSKTRQLQHTEYQHEQHLEQMLLNLTHDIKTPLTVATGYVQLIQQRPTMATPSTLRRILANLTSVNYYLHYLMDFNLVQAKTAHLNLESVNVSRFLEQELFNFFDDLTGKRITVTPEIAPNIQLMTDKLLLQRIIQNLVGNWLKYAVDTATITLKEADHHLIFELKNQTNEGLIKNTTLTQQFYTTNAHSAQSLGLGLTIVQSLVTVLGGKMSISTTSHTFAIKLIFRVAPPSATEIYTPTIQEE